MNPKITEFMKTAGQKPEEVRRLVSRDEPRFLFRAANGTVDLSTMKLTPYDGDEHLAMTPYSFKPLGKQPTLFLHAIRRMFACHNACDEYAAELLLWFGRMALGLGPKFPGVALVLHGGGRNGKTTLLDVVRAVLGDYSEQGPREIFGRQLYGSYAHLLEGRRSITMSETQGPPTSKEGRAWFKTIVSGEKFTVRELYAQELTQVQSRAVFVYDTNYPPDKKSLGKDPGTLALLRFLPASATLEEQDLRPCYDKVLLAEEGDAILTAILQAAHRQILLEGGPEGYAAPSQTEPKVPKEPQTTPVDVVRASYQFYRNNTEASGVRPMTYHAFKRKYLALINPQR